MSRGPLLEEEPKTKAIQTPSMTRGGALGTLAELQARPRRRDNKGVGSRCHRGEHASPPDPAPETACGLWALKASGGVEEGGGRF